LNLFGDGLGKKNFFFLKLKKCGRDDGKVIFFDDQFLKELLTILKMLNDADPSHILSKGIN
jgi:hypothetical protein